MSKVLVVDDDPVMAGVICEILQSGGHETAAASNGLEALERMGKELPEVALCDVMMPGMDGYTLVNKMLSDPALKGIPVIVLTSKGQMAEPFKQLSNAAGFIEKPADPDQLLALVAKAAARVSGGG